MLLGVRFEIVVVIGILYLFMMILVWLLNIYMVLLLVFGWKVLSLFFRFLVVVGMMGLWLLVVWMVLVGGIRLVVLVKVGLL